MVDIIATTAGKKFKELAALSSNLIKEYGISYFLKVAIYEIKKQKLGLLLPDATPKISLERDLDLDTAKSYEHFFKKNLLTLSEDEVENIITLAKNRIKNS